MSSSSKEEANPGRLTSAVGNASHVTESDLRNADYANMASAVFANTLRVLFEPNAQDNPIPDSNIQCYATGEKLPPQLTKLYDGDLGYGASINSLNDIRQHRMMTLTYIAIVNWFTKHTDTIKKRQNIMTLIVDTFAVGKAVNDIIPMEKDEDMDDYIGRIKSRLSVKQTQTESDSEPEPEAEPAVSKAKAKKDSSSKKKVPVTVPVAPTKVGKKSTPALVVESDTESEADLANDSDDSEAPVSESSIDVSSESEAPKKKIGGIKGKKFGRR